jgi:hypothetical protein
MRPTLGHTRPPATRYRYAPPVPGSLAWMVREAYRAQLETLRDTESAFVDAFRSRATMPYERPAIKGYDHFLTPVWSASEAEMTRFVTNAPD